jgi:hypothetical protein
MKRTTYLNAFHLLQLFSTKFDLIIDFNTVYFNQSNFTLEIAAIYSVLIEDDTLYILTKKNELHRINSSNNEHVLIDANCISILNTIKSFFNIN